MADDTALDQSLQGRGKATAHGVLLLSRRHRKVRKVCGADNISKGDMRRLARRGGVKRVQAEALPTAKNFMLNYMRELIRATINYTVHAQRSTVYAIDVVLAHKIVNGVPLVGFGPEPGMSDRVERKKIKTRKPANSTAEATSNDELASRAEFDIELPLVDDHTTDHPSTEEPSVSTTDEIQDQAMGSADATGLSDMARTAMDAMV